MAQIGGSAVSGGTFGAGTYYIVVTASDTQNQYESQIAPVSSGIVLTANQAISVVLPSKPGFTYNVYVGTTTTPTNLGLSSAGPTSGPMTGQATQLAPGTTVTITGAGVAQVPPSTPPASGLTVYPMWVFGRGAYGQVMLDDISTTYLTGADKSDPLNQQRVVGWKVMYGTIILNQMFMCMIESVSAFKATFDATAA